MFKEGSYRVLFVHLRKRTCHEEEISGVEHSAMKANPFFQILSAQYLGAKGAKK